MTTYTIERTIDEARAERRWLLLEPQPDAQQIAQLDREITELETELAERAMREDVRTVRANLG